MVKEKNQYDRGHLTPNSIFRQGINGKLTFYLTNVAPQVSGFNRGKWRDLEFCVKKFIESTCELKQMHYWTIINKWLNL